MRRVDTGNLHERNAPLLPEPERRHTRNESPSRVARRDLLGSPSPCGAFMPACSGNTRGSFPLRRGLRELLWFGPSRLE
jgi:hypothetical protein